MSDIDQLNRKHRIDDTVVATAGPGGFANIVVDNPWSRAEISLHGGHVRHWHPVDCHPVLWESAASDFAADRPIRGGIPVCWPWFGAHPTDADKPAHGFARVADWELRTTRALPRGHQVVLGLTDNAATRALWPHPFDLELEVTVGPRLHVSLRARNLGNKTLRCTAALHSYLAVSDVTDIAIHGLEDTGYIDTVGGARDHGQQVGPIRIAAETDRIYLDTDADCVVEDPGWQRRLRVGKSGSRTTVVWNPWVAKARRMPDFGDDEYPDMLCIEAANAEDDAQVLPPGGEARLATVLSVEPLSGELSR